MIGVLPKAEPLEQAVAVVPSERVSAREFLLILRENGVRVRILARGSALVSAESRRDRIPGALVIAVPKDQERKLRILSRICGVTTGPIPALLARDEAEGSC